MRRLAAHHAVRVDLDAEDDRDVKSIDCRAQTVLGPVATLTTVDEVAPSLRDRLTRGSLSFMTFTYCSAPVALRGVTLAVPNSEKLEFVVIDGIQLTERRAGARVALVTPVQAARVGADGIVTATVPTVTANLSIGGALLASRPGLGNGPRWQIELALPGDTRPVRCDALLVRQTRAHIGVKFAGLPEADQLRLAATLANRQRATPQAR
jgi:hypothetical protein